MKYFSPLEYVQYLYKIIYETISLPNEELAHLTTVCLCTICLRQIEAYCAFDNGFFREAGNEIHKFKKGDHLTFDPDTIRKVNNEVMKKQ